MRAGPIDFEEPLDVVTRSSTIVFHCPHSGQRPAHLGDWAPHCEQNHADLIVLAICGVGYKMWVYYWFLRNCDNITAVAIDTFNDSTISE